MKQPPSDQDQEADDIRARARAIYWSLGLFCAISFAMGALWAVFIVAVLTDLI